MLCENAERPLEGRKWRYELKLEGIPPYWAQVRTKRAAPVT